MSTTLYYFSGTGNSYIIAKEIQKRLGNCELTAITSIWNLDNIAAMAENIGFIFPLYCMGMPKVVLDFIRKIDLNNAKYIFTVVTRGGKGYQGGALKQTREVLMKKGKKLSSGFYIRMPDNYIPLLKVPPKEQQKIMFKEAAKKVEKISELISKKEAIMEKEYTAFAAPLLYKPFIKRVSQIDKGFHVTEKCNSCGMCEKVCHFNNIKMVEGKPKWQHNCQFCLACINYCPKKAMEYKKGSKGKERYNHPDVTINLYTKI
ncbi:MAG: EFR1 family ferrodoxin [Clostridia bacterium]|nr:EFR1 family ferrodoxin [Clostridia bacterium]